jgi:hypothetical protein
MIYSIYLSLLATLATIWYAIWLVSLDIRQWLRSRSESAINYYRYVRQAFRYNNRQRSSIVAMLSVLVIR